MSLFGRVYARSYDFFMDRIDRAQTRPRHQVRARPGGAAWSLLVRVSRRLVQLGSS